MKKFLALALAFVMMFSLAACGGGNDAPAGDEGADKVQVEVFWYDESDVYLSSVRNELNTKLDAMEGISYNNQFAANTQSTQIDQINTAIAGGANIRFYRRSKRYRCSSRRHPCYLLQPCNRYRQL